MEHHRAANRLRTRRAQTRGRASSGWFSPSLRERFLYPRPAGDAGDAARRRRNRGDVRDALSRGRNQQSRAGVHRPPPGQQDSAPRAYLPARIERARQHRPTGIVGLRAAAGRDAAALYRCDRRHLRGTREERGDRTRIRDRPRSPCGKARRAGGRAASGWSGILRCVIADGGMASFDLGVQGFGARIMLIVGERRVVLCTCEGTPRREADRLSLGPLSLSLTGGTLALDFAGPAAVVPDGSNYLSIERALATSNLDPAAQVTLGIPIADGFDPSTLFGNSRFDSEPRAASPLFAIGSGEARIEGVRCWLRASARAGASFSGLGPQRFAERRMIWALFESDARTEAIELRRVNHDAAPPHHNARILSAAGWSPLTLRSLEIE